MAKKERKPPKNPARQVNVMIDGDVVDLLQAQADSEGISRSDVVRMVINRHVRGTKREA